MNVTFKDKDIQELIQYGTSKKYKKYAKKKGFVERLVMIYNTIYNAKDAKELKNFSWLHYEALKHDFSGFNSIRINNNKWTERLIVRETEDGITIEMIEINDHYGSKK